MNMLPGPEKSSCACGCQLFGRPRTGKCAGHIRGCACPKCRGGRNRRAGLEKQRKAAKSLGVPRVGSLRPGNEEDWAGALRIESKSGAIVGPIITRYRLAEAQSEAQRPIGDHRPFLMAATHDGLAVGIFRLDRAADIAAALAENLGLLVGEGDVVPEEAEDGAQGAPLVGPEPGLPGPGLSGVVDAVEHGGHDG